MKYTSLKKDIISILHSSDYEFKLKIYDDDGNLTSEPEDSQWIYIENENIMLEFATEEDPVNNIWKEQGDISTTFEKVIQRIREKSILSGVSVQISLYNELNRRKIYNLIKNSIDKKKEEDMNESVIKSVSKTLYELSNTIHNTKRSSDNYISESMYGLNKMNFINDVINSVICLESLNDHRIKSLLNKTLLESSYKSIEKIVRVFESKYSTLFNNITSNISNIENLGKFMKQRYLNNYDSKSTPKTLLVMENVKVYPIKTKNDMTNLTKAYNHLLSVSKDAKSGTDILLAIKRNNICETYSISKNDLLDMWLSNSTSKPIKPKTLLVFENVKGETKTFNMDILASMHAMASHFNKNNLSEDVVIKNIVNETIKLNNLNDLIENYSYKNEVKKHAKTISSLIKECLENLNNYKENLSESKDNTLDYSKELAVLESSFGFTHPALKFIAIENSKFNKQRMSKILNESVEDLVTLRKGLLITNNIDNACAIADSIIKEKLIAKKQIKESKTDKLSLAKSLLEHIDSVNSKTVDAIKENLFVIINSPSKFNKERDNYIRTIKKFIV